mmetsp:Transcript_74539/g.136095  ORF Transcript_74539/g.136095 Transcript_74539/m.136095 type:complete len:319 (-) Transcript_74539:75-1031(-)
MSNSRRPSLEGSAGWIDVDKMNNFLGGKIRVLSAVDGSEMSMLGFEYAVKCLAISDRDLKLQVLHVYDDSKDYLHPRWRREYIYSTCEAVCVAHLQAQRYNLAMIPRNPGEKVGVQLVEAIKELGADFTVMGIYGRKGRVFRRMLASNVMEVMQRGRCSCILIQTESLGDLPVGRPTVFVVSVSLNVAATKAFFDALRLSKPGDSIHVVYIKSYLEQTDSDYTVLLREKYAQFFTGLKDAQEEVLSKFGDREVVFRFVNKLKKETTASAVVRYADHVEADFVLVGTNSMRVEKGKSILGSVSLQICMETCRNLVISNY